MLDDLRRSREVHFEYSANTALLGFHSRIEKTTQTSTRRYCAKLRGRFLTLCSEWVHDKFENEGKVLSPLLPDVLLTLLRRTSTSSRRETLFE